MKISIVIAAHKHFWHPDHSVYLPLHVGAEGKESIGFRGDNTGAHISFKNKNYCELTGLYWAWKNLCFDYLGLVHYRRYFAKRNFFVPKKNTVLSTSEITQLLSTNNVILPTKRNYFIETNYSQYVNAHSEKDLQATAAVLSKHYPAYVSAWERCMYRTAGHRFNMFVMKKKFAEAYCEWLFGVLALVENKLNASQSSLCQERIYGYIGERLLDVWIEQNQVDYCEQPVVNLENQNWPKKICSFLYRKYSHQHYKR